jgi:hypothetical protein
LKVLTGGLTPARAQKSIKNGGIQLWAGLEPCRVREAFERRSRISKPKEKPSIGVRDGHIVARTTPCCVHVPTGFIEIADVECRIGRLQETVEPRLPAGGEFALGTNE